MTAARPAIPRTMWALGFVSLFTDLGSELAHSLLPVLLAGTLGASALTIGLIEGAALLLASAIAGWLWDRHGPAAAFQFGVAAALAATQAIPLLGVRNARD